LFSAGDQKSYILDILYTYHVHPYPNSVRHGDQRLSSDIITSISATVGVGFFGGLLFGFALKKVVKVFAVIVAQVNRIIDTFAKYGEI
jgi:uncharacterized membrane protein (Fun14 family)